MAEHARHGIIAEELNRSVSLVFSRPVKRWACAQRGIIPGHGNLAIHYAWTGREPGLAILRRGRAKSTDWRQNSPPVAGAGLEVDVAVGCVVDHGLVWLGASRIAPTVEVGRSKTWSLRQDCLTVSSTSQPALQYVQIGGGAMCRSVVSRADLADFMPVLLYSSS